MDGTNGRITNLELTTQRIETKVDGIAESLHVLTRLEERQVYINDRLAEGSKTMGDLRERVSDLEREMPALKETRQDIRKLTWLVLGAVVVALLALVIGGKP